MLLMFGGMVLHTGPNCPTRREFANRILGAGGVVAKTEDSPLKERLAVLLQKQLSPGHPLLDQP
jgi:hypothetical protein